MGAEANQVAVSVAEFCRAVRISRSFFYRLRREGRGPATFKLGRKTLISTEAATSWLRGVEQGRAPGLALEGAAK